MNEVPLNHPGDEALRALSLGQLAEAELATVYAHLSECPACCRRIDQLATDDCLLARLQQIAASREEGLVTPAQRRPAVGALRQLPDVRSATRIMKPVLFREAKGESDPVVRPSSDAMPQQSETGDRYQLFGEIARGGMGAVLRGRDRDLGRDLAVKVLLVKHANLPDVARRFVEEAQIGGQLQHPGVVPVYDIGQFGDRPFFTMKLVQGMTLAAILGEREQPTDDRPRLLNIALQVAQALAYAHAKGVIHRDLKPANIMVGAFGEVQVMDWGLAKVLKEGGAADEERAGRQDQPEEETMIRTARSSGTARSFGKETEAGWVLGTPAYMPPEQAKGEIARLDRRADVFGLGAILCEVLTGEPPYVGQSSEEVQIKAATGALAEAHARLDGSGAHPELIVLTKWCLSPEASDRPSDAQGVADGLSKYLNGVQERLQASERERAVAVVRASEEGKRRKVQLALAAALVGLLVGGGAFAFWRNEQAQVGRERDARNAEAVAALLSQCEEALRANEGAKAAVALEAATKRAAEGGAQEQAERLGRLDADLALVRDLDTIDQFRWSVVGGKLPGPAVVATRTREALSRFGADPDAVSVEEAAARVSASVVPQRIVSALDRLLRAEKRDGVRTLLRRVDAKPYRDAVRDALLADDEAKFVELVGQKAALEQPPGFVAFLGEHGAIPVQRWRQLLQAAVSQRPGDVALLITLGQTYMINQKMADQGRWWFQAAVAAAPTNATAHNNLGSALLDNGQVEEAIACYHKAIALDPKHAPAHYNLGMALAGKGQVDEAIPFYQKAIELDPKFAPAHTNLGNALMSKGKVEEAMACYRQAIAVDPKYALAHNVLGNELYGKGQHDEAIAFFHKAIELDGTIAEAHYNLGYALAAKGQHDEAIACYRQVITLAPEYAEAYHNLGAILCDIKRDYDGAIACLQKAIALKPNLAQAHYNLGLALFGKGRFAEALAAVKRGHELGTKRRDWPYPSAAWVRYAERLAALEAQLPALLKGEFQPRDTAQRLELAGVCQVKKLHHTAAGLYAAAFAADAKLADDLNACHRYNAACHAALAAAGQGEDAAKLDDKERTRLRQQALAWLRDDLALWAKQLENGQPADHVTVQQTLKHWQQDTDLAGLRDAAALAKLPAEEQEACTQLWADVAALLKKAEEKPN